MGISAKFTPGPWHVYFAGRGDTCVLAANKVVAHVAQRPEDGLDGTEQLDANTNLIAAAPELYEALVDARETLEAELGMSADILVRIDGILSKAEGRR